MTRICALIIFALVLTAATAAFAEEAKELSAKQRAVAPIAAFTAKGDQAKLRSAMERGLEAGLSVNGIKEILIQMSAYCGFPRSLNAINTFGALLDDRAAQGIKDTIGEEPKAVPTDRTRERIGHENRVKLTGSTAVGSYAKVVPTIDIFLKEHLFCDVFARGLLTDKERELCTVSMLCVLPGAEAQLAGHRGAAEHVGNTPAALDEAVDLARAIR